MASYSPELRSQALKLSDSIGTNKAAAKLGIPAPTISTWRTRAGLNGAPKAAPASGTLSQSELELAKMEAASLRAELERVKGRDMDDPAAVWAATEEANAKRIERTVEQRQVVRVFGDERPIGIACVSDQHISAGCVDLKRMREDAELIRVTDGLYCLLGGDGVDNAIKHRAAMVNAEMPPSMEWKLYGHYLAILQEKVLGLIGGNHDVGWARAMAGIDPVAWLAEHRGIRYVPDEIRLSVQLPGVSYRLAMRHKYRFGSAMNQGHSVRRWWEFGEEPFDVGILCHHHEASVDCFRRHGREIWAIRPGSYQVASGYSMAEGFRDSQPACPTIILYPRQHQIHCVSDIKLGAELLAKLRS